jgi:hypothetical protein
MCGQCVGENIELIDSEEVEVLARAMFACACEGYDRGRNGRSFDELMPPAVPDSFPVYQREVWLAAARRVLRAMG